MIPRVLVSFVLASSLFLPGGSRPIVAASAGQTPQASTLRLYIRSEPWNRDLSPLDPTTLATAAIGPHLTIGGQRQPAPQQVVASADGNTLAAISTRLTVSGPVHARDITIRIIDAWSGTPRVAFHPPVPLTVEGLSADGSQLFGYTAGSRGRSTEWYVLNAANGRTLGKFEVAGCCSRVLDDSATHRLYVLRSTVMNRPNQMPQPPTLAAYDLTSGREVASTRLNGIVAGSGVVTEGARAPEILDWQPGVALSPDGRQLAVFDGNSQTLLLMTTDHLKIVDTEHVVPPSSLLDHLGNLLGLLPETALAKEWIGTTVDLQFSPDGRSLYASGREGRVTGGVWSMHGLGLERIDVASGQIAAQALPNQWVTNLSVAPDGSALYTLNPSNPAGGSPTTLRRLDALTLQTMTSRQVYDPPDMYWLATPVLGAPGCRPASPSRSSGGMGIEVRGTGRHVQIWALVQASFPIQAGHAAKIVWRMTGQGSFHIVAENTQRIRIRPTWGPEAHLGSSWNRPGAEWGTGFTFPSSGCWEIHATRGKSAGSVWFQVVSAGQS